MNKKRVLCHSCSGKGFIWDTPINSEFQEVAILCPECEGKGFVEDDLYFLECFGHPNRSDACDQCPKNSACFDAEETIEKETKT